jgi:hypothetical protein
VSCEFLTPLIDKEALLIEELWGRAIFFYVELKELGGFLLDLYEAEPVSFAQDGQSLFLGVEVIQTLGKNFP